MFEFEFFAGIAGWVLPLASIGIILFGAGAPITSLAGSIGPMLQRHRTRVQSASGIRAHDF